MIRIPQASVCHNKNKEGVCNHQIGTAHGTPKSSAATQNSEDAMKNTGPWLSMTAWPMSQQERWRWLFLSCWFFDMMAIHQHGFPSFQHSKNNCLQHIVFWESGLLYEFSHSNRTKHKLQASLPEPKTYVQPKPTSRISHVLLVPENLSQL